MILEEQHGDEFHLEKVKLEIGNKTETSVEVLNSEELQGKQILVKGNSMLLNDSEGGHAH